MSPSLIASILSGYNSNRDNRVRAISIGGSGGGSRNGHKIDLVPRCTLFNFDTEIPVDTGGTGNPGDCGGEGRGSVGGGIGDPRGGVVAGRQSEVESDDKRVAGLGKLGGGENKGGNDSKRGGGNGIFTGSKIQLSALHGVPGQTCGWLEESSGGEVSNGEEDSVIHMEGFEGLGKSETRKDCFVSHDEGWMDRSILKSSIFYSYGILLFLSLLCAWALSWFYRYFVRAALLLFHGSRIWLIGEPLDAIWAYETEFSSSNIVFALRCQGVPDIDRMIDDFERKVLKHRTLMKVQKSEDDKDVFYKMHTPYEKLTWIVRSKLLFYCWEKDEDFNVRNHFYIEKVMDEGQNLEERIQAVCEAYLECQLDKSRPQWEFRVIAPVGGEGSRNSDYGLIFCVHHTYGDGLSWMQMFTQCFADDVVPLPFDPMKAPPSNPKILQRSWVSQLCASLLQSASLVFLLPHAFASQVVEMMEEKNDFHGPCSTGSKSCKWSHKSVPLASIKCLQVEYKSSKRPLLFTSILLASITSAFRRSVESIQGKIPYQVLAGIPYAALPYKSLEPTNKFTMVLSPLPVRIANNRDLRLCSVNESVIRDSSQLKVRLNSILTNICGSLIIPFIKLSVSQAARSSLCMSNLPGPKRAMKLFGGQRVSNFLLFPPLKYHTGIIMGVLSYDDFVSLSIAVDCGITQKHPTFAPTFLKFVEQELSDITHILNNNNDYNNNSKHPPSHHNYAS